VGARRERCADRILPAVSAVARTGGAVYQASGTIQANIMRSRADGQGSAEGGVPIRLVKGAYVEDAQVARLPGDATDLALLELAHELHANGAEVANATDDAVLREALLRPSRVSASRCCLACGARTRRSAPAAECPPRSPARPARPSGALAAKRVRVRWL
jgi:hypothetical protein